MVYSLHGIWQGFRAYWLWPRWSCLSAATGCSPDLQQVGEYLLDWRHVPAADPLVKQFEASASHQRARNLNRSQLQEAGTGKTQVIETGHCHITRYPPAQLLTNVKDAEGNQIVPAEYAVDLRVRLEQLRGSQCPGFPCQRSPHSAGIHNLGTGGCYTFSEACYSVPRNAGHLRPPENSYPAASGPADVFTEFSSGAEVVDHD